MRRAYTTPCKGRSSMKFAIAALLLTGCVGQVSTIEVEQDHPETVSPAPEAGAEAGATECNTPDCIPAPKPRRMPNPPLHSPAAPGANDAGDDACFPGYTTSMCCISICGLDYQQCSVACAMQEPDAEPGTGCRLGCSNSLAMCQASCEGGQS